MQHPRDPFSSDDSADSAEDGAGFSRPRSSPHNPSRSGEPPRPAPSAPPETHHTEAVPYPDAVPYENDPAEEEPDYSSFGSPVLFESWEPQGDPADPADPMWDGAFQPGAPAAEFSAAELSEELAREPAYAGDPWGGELPARTPVARRTMPPLPPEPWIGPRHARRRGGHWSGALLALTGAVALAGAVPIGILGVRTLTQQPAATVTTAPMADGSAISAPASVAAPAPSQLSQGQTAVGPSSSAAPPDSARPGTTASSPARSGGTGSRTATGAAGAAAGAGAAGAGAASSVRAATFAVTAGPGCRSLNGVITWPFRAPDGDGWHPAAASSNGPCGAYFTYSLLANVRNNSGNWHDHYAWIFHTGKAVASCTLSVYVPASAHANSDAFYWISTGSDNPENRMADFTIDQRASAGQWVTKGPFTFPGGTVLAEVTDRGVGSETDSVEAGAFQLRCV